MLSKQPEREREREINQKFPFIIEEQVYVVQLNIVVIELPIQILLQHHFLHFVHFTVRFTSRADIVMLVQDELSKIQVNCGSTESEITESIMIKSCYVTYSYSMTTHN